MSLVLLWCFKHTWHLLLDATQTGSPGNCHEGRGLRFSHQLSLQSFRTSHDPTHCLRGRLILLRSKLNDWQVVSAVIITSVILMGSEPMR